ncbi:hypothetical protein VP01_989g1 [Puccinia sorghi]|uniref:Uncharacterized protein n=1 Tax=Puccinia sorghi TaxID=27349 RepID=A0A0L6U7G8_9BASI|nr:hypothetical protein VP01_989g1 [Puccinia sorghi]
MNLSFILLENVCVLPLSRHNKIDSSCYIQWELDLFSFQTSKIPLHKKKISKITSCIFYLSLKNIKCKLRLNDIFILSKPLCVLQRVLCLILLFFPGSWPRENKSAWNSKKVSLIHLSFLKDETNSHCGKYGKFLKYCNPQCLKNILACVKLNSVRLCIQIRSSHNFKYHHMWSTIIHVVFQNPHQDFICHSSLIQDKSKRGVINTIFGSNTLKIQVKGSIKVCYRNKPLLLCNFPPVPRISINLLSLCQLLLEKYNFQLLINITTVSLQPYLQKLKIPIKPLSVCKACSISKVTKATYQHRLSWESKLLKDPHLDLIGLIAPVSHKNHNYILTIQNFIFSLCSPLPLIQRKSVLVERGSKFINGSLEDYCRINVIRQRYSTAY